MSAFEPRIIARDRLTGKLVTFRVLPDGRYAVDTSVDVQPIVDRCAAARSNETGNWKGEMHLAASIPMHMWQSLRTEGRVQEVRDFKKWLNDSSVSKLRMKTGKL